MPIVLTERDVANLLKMEELIPLMERTLADFSAGRAIQPVRTVLSFDRHASFVGVMPGCLTATDAFGIKVVAFAPRNAGRGLPTHQATILLLDPETGSLLAIVDGRLITEMRTAAVSAAASRVLARPGASRLSILGSGVQARSHLEAFRLVHRLERVRVWSPTPSRREAFAREESARRELRVEAAATAEEAVRGADLVVTATSSPTPVLLGAWLEDGAHVTGVGACRPTWREMDTEAVRRARVFVDSMAAARVEAGDLLLSEKEGGPGPDRTAGEIGAVFARRLPGRTAPGQVTLFKSLGLAVEDAAAARHVHDAARSRGGAGTEIALE